MRINAILDIYKFKVKTFFGALRASKASLALLFVYTLGFIPSVFALSMMIINTVRQGNINMELYIGILTAIMSGFMALTVILALRGYTAFEYEQNFIFTSPITSREFLVASILADLTSSLVFTNPVFILYVTIVFLLNLPIFSALLMLLTIFLFVFMLFFLKISLSIIKSLYKSSWTNIFMLILLILFLIPVIGFLTNSPLKGSYLPYPSTFLAKVLLDLVYGEAPRLSDILGLAFYFSLSAAFFTFVSEKNVFPHASQIPFASPFDTSMRMQTLKMERSIRMFSKIGLFLKLNLESKSLLTFLMKKEIIRIVREGSLFAIIFLYLVISLVFAATGIGTSRNAQPSPNTLLMFFVGTYSLIVPLMLVSNWRFSDLENLWVPLTSSVNIRTVVKALLYVFMLISSAIPATVVLILSVVSKANPLLPLVLIISASMIGCSVNLYLMVKFLGKRRHGTPSLFIGWASMLFSGLLLAPVYISIVISLYLTLNNVINTLISAIALAYSAVIMRYFSNKTERNIINIEI